MIKDFEIEALSDDTLRVEICRTSFRLFFYWYFSKYIKVQSPEFHKQWKKDFKDMNEGVFKNLMLLGFRSSAKTALTRAFVMWQILYERKKNVFWISYALQKAEKNARAIANELQANKLIIQDFGQLFFSEVRREGVLKKSVPKQLRQFKAENGTMFTATSTNITTRGDLEDEFRPDLVVFDDVENDKTKRSRVISLGIISSIEELMGGMENDYNLIFLGNFISKYGVIANFRNRIEGNDSWRLRVQNLTKKGEITWKSKFVFTQKEAKKINEKILDRKRHVVSIEELKKNLGSMRFEQEYNNTPMSLEMAIVKEEWYSNGKGKYSKTKLFFDEKHKRIIFRKDGGNYPLVVFTAIDPAISQKTTSDDRAICTMGTFVQHYEGKEVRYFLVLEEKAGIWSLANFTKNLKNTINKFWARMVGVESNGVQQLFREVFSLFGISSVALNPDSDKVRRLSRHTAEMEFERVLFPDDGSCNDTLFELFEFTGESGGIDNRVDAFSYAMDMCKGKQGRGVPQKTKEGKTIVGNVRVKEF